DGTADSLPHGGAAARIDARDALFHLLYVIGEFHVQVSFVIEIDDENFVVRVGGFYQIDGGDLHYLALLLHAAAIVDNDTQRDWHVLVLENLDGLFDPVFKNLEGLLLKVHDQLAVLVGNADRQDHPACIGGKGSGLVSFSGSRQLGLGPTK